MVIILKKDLKPWKYYVGKTYQRGMPVGVWDQKKQKFICINPELGGHMIYEMNHIEDDDGFVCFEPVREVETND